MSSKLIPKDPASVAVIRNITPNVATVSVPFSRFGKIQVGGRATIIRMTSGAIAVFSPVALTDEVRAKVAEMGGRVGYLIAGDMEHHIFLSEWKRAYPDARLVGPAGLPEKRAKMQGDDKINGSDAFAVVLTPENAHDAAAAIGPEFAADFDVEYVAAHPNKEIVLCYRPDGGVLVEADLMFNLPAVEQYSRVPEAERRAGNGLLNKLFVSLNGTQGPAKGQKRLQWYALSSGGEGGRAAYNASVQRIDGWAWDRLVPCHGEVIERDAKATFRKVFEWHLRGHK
ncbi:hypothetical protein GGR56DRAFT_447372 [Xylariaceae sp. FL0804]|nr:hypothetical protein GGR56DRAFT_447372 [Xylariaceae sp. FL0804]